MKRIYSFIIGSAICISAFAGFDPTARPFDSTEKDDHVFTQHLSPAERNIIKQIQGRGHKLYPSKNDAGRILRMIVKRDGKYIAYLGNLAVSVGDYVGSMRVSKISQHSVTLDDGQNAITLTLSGYVSHHLSNENHKFKMSQYDATPTRREFW